MAATKEAPKAAEPKKNGDTLKLGQQVFCSKDLGSVSDLKNEPLVATVAAVHCDGTVNLCVLDREGKPHQALYVPVITEHKKGKKQKMQFCCPDCSPDICWDPER